MVLLACAQSTDTHVGDTCRLDASSPSRPHTLTLRKSPRNTAPSAGPLTNGGVVDVVIGGDHAQVQGCHVHLILDADTLGLLQVTQGLLHQF